MTYENRLPNGDVVGCSPSLEDALKQARRSSHKLNVHVKTVRRDDKVDMATSSPSNVKSLHMLAPRIESIGGHIFDEAIE